MCTSQLRWGERACAKQRSMAVLRLYVYVGRDFLMKLFPLGELLAVVGNGSRQRKAAPRARARTEAHCPGIKITRFGVELCHSRDRLFEQS